MSMHWLREKAPGFNELSPGECNAICSFSLLWSLFEAQILESAGSAAHICKAVDSWREAETIRAETYEPELTYFRQRYFADDQFTYHFNNLHLRKNDRPNIVKTVINGTNNVPRDGMVTALIITLRFRNNLFHGVKWQYELAGQLENFTNANNLLMKVLEHHGKLAGG